MSFQLAAASGQSVVTPTNLSAQAFTQPGTGLAASVARKPQAAAAGLNSFYESLRRRLSPAYARAAASRHLAVHRQTLKLSPRNSVFGQYAIETDLSFDNTQSSNLSGFTIYRTQGSTLPTQSPADAYDFLQDPLANFYTDLDPSYVSNQQVNFAVSATNTARAEGALSAPVSITPLDLLTVIQPQAGDTVTSLPAFAWNPVSGVAGYRLFIYNQFPSINSTDNLALDSGATLIAATITSVVLLKPLPGGQDYYVVVAGVNSASTAITLSQITRFHVQ